MSDTGFILGVVFGSLFCVASNALIIFCLCRQRRKHSEGLASRGYTCADYSKARAIASQTIRSRTIMVTDTRYTGEVVTRYANLNDLKRAMGFWCTQGMIANPSSVMEVTFQNIIDQIASQRRGGEQHPMVISQAGQNYSQTQGVSQWEQQHQGAPGVSQANPHPSDSNQTQFTTVDERMPMATAPPSYADVKSGGY